MSFTGEVAVEGDYLYVPDMAENARTGRQMTAEDVTEFLARHDQHMVP